MLNIWIFNHYANAMYKNAGGRHYWFAKNLTKSGYKPSIFCANAFDAGFERIEIKKGKYSSSMLNGIPFIFIKTIAASGNGMKRVCSMVLFALNLIFVAKKYAQMHGKPDVILASSVHPFTLLAGLRVAKSFGIPCICEVRDLWPEAIFTYGFLKPTSILGKILTHGEHRIYRKADALIFTKEGDTDYLKEQGWTTEQGGDIPLSKCYYINNGVDLPAYNEQRNNASFYDKDLMDETKFTVMYTGAIRAVNKVGQILDCAALLQEYPQIQFVIYGDGYQLQELMERVEKERLTNVIFKGFTNKKNIPAILSHSSVNLLNYSSGIHGWRRGDSSNKLFEYMASGKPIIATSKMGYSTLEKYQCGIELENYSPQALRDAILSVYHMPADEYNAIGKCAETGAKDFDFALLTDKLVRVIQAVCIKESR